MKIKRSNAYGKAHRCSTNDRPSPYTFLPRLPCNKFPLVKLTGVSVCWLQPRPQTEPVVLFTPTSQSPHGGYFSCFLATQPFRISFLYLENVLARVPLFQSKWGLKWCEGRVRGGKDHIGPSSWCWRRQEHRLWGLLERRF